MNDVDFFTIWSVEELEMHRMELYTARHTHVLRYMEKANVQALLLVDPNDIFYATGAKNMTQFTQRTPARYLLILANGKTILYDFVGCEHLAHDLPTIDEIRIAEGLNTISSGGQVAEASARFATEIASAAREHDPSIDLIHLDRFPFQATDALRKQGFRLAEADDALLPARAMKLAIELPYIREAMARINQGVARLESKAEPGKSESEVWAEFHYALMAKEGQYVATRLFQSGGNTFPYFQECGVRKLCPGDLLCLDTDAVAYENYCVDFSRTFLCGDIRVTSDQRLLYGRAREQLEHNASLLKPWVSFHEFAEQAWKVPEEHMESRYYCVGHGLGMSGEWPNIPHHVVGKPYSLDGHIEPGMIICLESYVGWSKSAEGVKLEDQFLVHEDRIERMSLYHFDERLG